MTLSEYLDLRLTKILLTDVIVRGGRACVWRPKSKLEDGRTRYESFPLVAATGVEDDQVQAGDFIQIGHSVLGNAVSDCTFQAGLKFKILPDRHSTVLL